MALGKCQGLSFLSRFHKDEPVALMEMRTEHVCKVLRAGTAIALYCQTLEGMHHMLGWVFVDSKLSSAFMNGAGYIQKILETWLRRSLVTK